MVRWACSPELRPGSWRTRCKGAQGVLGRHLASRAGTQCCSGTMPWECPACAHHCCCAHRRSQEGGSMPGTACVPVALLGAHGTSAHPPLLDHPREPGVPKSKEDCQGLSGGCKCEDPCLGSASRSRVGLWFPRGPSMLRPGTKPARSPTPAQSGGQGGRAPGGLPLPFPLPLGLPESRPQLL